MRISLRILLCATPALLFTSRAYSRQAPPAETNRGKAKQEKRQAEKAAKEINH
jgi:hypothetical protein